MDLTLKESKTENNKLDLFKDPFDKGNVETIMFYISKSHFNEEISMSSNVKFRNGNTKGEQEIKADDFNTLVEATKDFIDSLEKEVKNG